MRTLFRMVCVVAMASCTNTPGNVGEGEGEPIGEGEGESPLDPFRWCLTPEGVGGCDTVEGGEDCPPQPVQGMSGTPCAVALIHCTWCHPVTGANFTMQCGDDLLMTPFVWQSLSDPSCFSEGM
jgi:hypothetical protein